MPDWTRIVEQHGPIVWKTAYRLLNHDADAHDCFQNTFVSAIAVARKQAVKNWPGLLKQLATARALDRLRQRYRDEHRAASTINAEFTEDLQRQPGFAAEAGEFSHRLRIALAKLDERQAEVFCLVCLEEQPYADVAALLNISVNHVGVLLNRAKSGLQKHMRAFAPGT